MTRNDSTTRTSARRGYPIKNEWRGGAAPLRVAPEMERVRDANASDYFFFALAVAAALSAYFFWKRSTRPAVSISFCLPVKNG